MKTPIKVLLLFAVVAALVVGGGYWFVSNRAGDLAQSTVASATGSEQLGELASKVMSGEDLTDSEIQDATGLDSATYQKVKEAASDAGIDLNDSSQLRDIAVKNADKADDVMAVVEQVKDGNLTEAQAAKKLEGLIER